MTTQPLAENARVSELERPTANTFRPNRLVPWGFMVIFIGVAIGLIGKKVMHEEIVTIVGVLVSLAGMLLTAYTNVSSARPQRYQSKTSTPPDVLTPPPATKYLPHEGRIEPIPSITERTTGLLMNPAPTRTRKKEEPG